jgi:hypothetical protein
MGKGLYIIPVYIGCIATVISNKGKTGAGGVRRCMGKKEGANKQSDQETHTSIS